MRKTPQRSCVSCRKVFDKKDLVRIVRTPEGTVILDRTGRANGRGAYIHADAACLEKAERSKAPDRSLKCAVPGEIYREIEKELEKNGG
mgnify:CR=1 FL=1